MDQGFKVGWEGDKIIIIVPETKLSPSLKFEATADMARYLANTILRKIEEMEIATRIQ